MGLNSRINRIVFPLRDKRIKRRVIIIESDDWGSIRVPSRDIYYQLVNDGYNAKRTYSIDSLERPKDLICLFDVLNKFRDSNNNPPVFTANTLVANPDFEKIKESGFKTYNYELLPDTYIKYCDGEDMFSIIKKGIDLGVWYPQSHGREHFNIPYWLSLLRQGDKDMLYAFNHNMCGIYPRTNPSYGNKCLIAYNAIHSEWNKFYVEAVRDGLHIFRNLFKYSSKTFIPPAYTWNNDIETVLSEEGVELIQSGRVQHIATNIKKRIYHYIGERNQFAQLYSVRNCTFEPAAVQSKTLLLKNILKQVDNLFLHHRPVIISSHRVNYIGSISESNRSENLELLGYFLDSVLRKYPDVEFLTSEELIDIVK